MAWSESADKACPNLPAGAVPLQRVPQAQSGPRSAFEGGTECCVVLHAIRSAILRAFQRAGAEPHDFMRHVDSVVDVLECSARR